MSLSILIHQRQGLGTAQLGVGSGVMEPPCVHFTVIQSIQSPLSQR